MAHQREREGERQERVHLFQGLATQRSRTQQLQTEANRTASSIRAMEAAAEQGQQVCREAAQRLQDPGSHDSIHVEALGAAAKAHLRDFRATCQRLRDCKQKLVQTQLNSFCHAAAAK